MLNDASADLNVCILADAKLHSQVAGAVLLPGQFSMKPFVERFSAWVSWFAHEPVRGRSSGVSHAAETFPVVVPIAEMLQ